MHGHNYRIHFTIEAPQLDNIGRVLDFSVIKLLLCEWLEISWDHKFLVFKEDPWAPSLKEMDPNGVVVVDFNPTAENMATYLLEDMGPKLLKPTPCKLIKVTIEETRKCSASASL
jgi:6-pyruvoyltetrahydropterin/6-carboxytetrahydropterin synthase